jgi:hypothetical protein
MDVTKSTLPKKEWRDLVRPPLEPADCVCCGEAKQTGRYAGLPVCFPCYETGLLREWLEQHNALE